MGDAEHLKGFDRAAEVAGGKVVNVENASLGCGRTGELRKLSMSLAEEVDVLRQIALFERMEPAKLKLLAMTSDRVTFRPGGTMMRQGDDGDAAYVVITGEANVLVNTPSGPLKVAELGAGQIVGEIAILVDIPRTATVEAQDELVALKISKDNFLRLLNSSSQVGIEIIRVLASRLENTTNQLREAIAKIPK